MLQNPNLLLRVDRETEIFKECPPEETLPGVESAYFCLFGEWPKLFTHNDFCS
jgi:hypothetical protein